MTLITVLFAGFSSVPYEAINQFINSSTIALRTADGSQAKTGLDYET